MGLVAVIAGVAAAAAAGGSAIYAAKKQARAERAAARMQADAQEKAAAQQAAEMNRMNRRAPDTESILEQNSGGDTGGTMLTGAAGVDANSLKLGKGSTLLGG
jgi:type II secretory pathway pseudopilin PulG